MTPPEKIQQIKELAFQGQKAPKIAELTGIPYRTVRRYVKQLKETTLKSLKDDEQIVAGVHQHLKGSLEQRTWLMDKMKAIIDSPPRKFLMQGTKLDEKTGKRITVTEERELDDRALRVKAILGYNELRNSFDEILGIRDVATRKEMDEIREIIARAKERAEGAEERGSEPS